jgi:hypothetical protein
MDAPKQALDENEADRDHPEHDAQRGALPMPCRGLVHKVEFTPSRSSGVATAITRTRPPTSQEAAAILKNVAEPGRALKDDAEHSVGDEGWPER